MRFVIARAYEYVDSGIPVEDLIQEGYVGLCKAVDRFDPLKGYKFITFASWWIWQAIIQFIANNSHIVRVPANKLADIRKLKKVEEELQRTLGRIPSLAELEQELPNLDVPKLIPWLGMVNNRKNRNPETDEETRLSLSEQNEIDLLAKNSGIPFPQPDDELLARSDLEEIQSALDRLTEREAAILRMYYGLEELTPMTLEEIGELFNLTRERIRQIKGSALKRLAEKGVLSG